MGEFRKAQAWVLLYCLLELLQSLFSSIKLERFHIHLEGNFEDLAYFMWKPKMAVRSPKNGQGSHPIPTHDHGQYTPVGNILYKSKLIIFE